jgi:hypothetical protein
MSRLFQSYACEVWDGCYERDIEKLEKIQLEAARIVTGLTKFVFHPIPSSTL